MGTIHPRTKKILLIGILCGLFASEANAIPPFARKYGTSCMTCHTAFPKLNAFGEAFRRNGYQMPGDDEIYVKVEPVKLGAEAYKRVWPESVWPGQIPGLPPISFRVPMTINFLPGRRVDTDFSTPDSLSLLLGGTIGQNLSFYGDIGLVEDGEFGGIGRLFFQWSNILSSRIGENHLNLRVGQFEPLAVPFSSHRRLGLADYALNAYTVRTLSVPFGPNQIDPRPIFPVGGGHHGGGLALSRSQKGIEIDGIWRHRLYYGAGLVNGSGDDSRVRGTLDTNSDKDYYFRLLYKFGGLGLDGWTGDDTDEELALGGMSTGSLYGDNSLQVGAFAYFGNPKSATNRTGRIQDEFLPVFRIEKYQRYGLDLQWNWRNLEIFGAYMHAEDDTEFQIPNQLGGGIGNVLSALFTPNSVLGGQVVDDTDFNTWFVQADYAVYPWLTPYARYEQVDRDTFDDITRIVGGAVCLVRANFRLTAEAQLYPDVARANTYALNMVFVF